MEQVLFLHHFEKMWENSMAKFDATFEGQTEKVLDFLEHNDIDRVILTRFEEMDIDEEQRPIADYCYRNGIQFDLEVYGYGMHRDREDMYPEEDFGTKWCQGTRSHHGEDDVLDIEDFHHELKNAKMVYLAGAFEGECVLDQEAIFDEIEVKYEKIEGLVVGDYLEYEFKGQTLSEFIEEKIEKHEEEMRVLSEEYDCEEEFQSLINNAPDDVETILDSLKNDLEEDDRLLDCSLMVSSSYQEFSEIVQCVMTDDDYEYDLIIEKINNAKELVENTKSFDIDTYYHGTFWKKPDNKDDDEFYHDSIETSYNDDDAVYFSNSEDVANNFSLSKSKSEDNTIPVIFKIEIELEKSYVHDSNDLDINVFEEELSLSDRESLYIEFYNNDYDSFIIPNNYPEGSDVAYLKDIDADEIESAKAYIDNKWTDYMSIDELKEIILENTLKPEKKNKQRNRKKI